METRFALSECFPVSRFTHNRLCQHWSNTGDTFKHSKHSDCRGAADVI